MADRILRIVVAVGLAAVVGLPGCLLDPASSPAVDLPGSDEGPDLPEGANDVPGPDSALPGGLAATPDPIDFEAVGCCGTKDLDVVLTNRNPWPVSVSSISLALAGDAGFTLESIALPGGGSLPLALGLGESVGLVLRYTASIAGSVATTLTVEAVENGQPVSYSFDVLATSGPCPVLEVVPGAIDFSWVAPPDVRAVEVHVVNPGSADLVIPAGGVTFAAGSDPGLAVKGLSQDGLTIAPGASVGFFVEWIAQATTPDTSDPIGTLDIVSNDLCHSPLAVPILGRIDRPCVAAIPDMIDMGFAAQMTPIARMVTLRNDCHGTLTVGSITVVDASDGGASGDFTLAVDGGSDGTILAFEIPGNASRAVTVRFTARSPAAHITATLRIVSDDPSRPTVDVPISVSITGPGPCVVALVPAALTFGDTPVGTAVERTINLVNTGTGSCTFQHADVADCPAGTDGTPVCPASLPGDPSTAYSLTGLPPLVQNGLAPGSSTPITVRFAPPAAGPDPSVPLVYPALLSVKVRDPLQGSTIELPKPAPGGTFVPNLTGSATVAP